MKTDMIPKGGGPGHSPWPPVARGRATAGEVRPARDARTPAGGKTITQMQDERRQEVRDALVVKVLHSAILLGALVAVALYIGKITGWL